MKMSTKQILNLLHILSWIIFIGVCIEAGGFIFNAFFTLVINPSDAGHFWREIDFSHLYAYGTGYFIAEVLLIIFVSIMKAYMFYLIVKMLGNKSLSMSHPFSAEMGRFIFRIAYMALRIGILAWIAVGYNDWLVKQGVKMPEIEYLRLGGVGVWLFMGMALLVIAQIFKRGIELQSENELTV